VIRFNRARSMIVGDVDAWREHLHDRAPCLVPLLLLVGR
jgi:hypothetical protein